VLRANLLIQQMFVALEMRQEGLLCGVHEARGASAGPGGDQIHFQPTRPWSERGGRSGSRVDS
jgi:hypothetical protein